MEFSATNAGGTTVTNNDEVSSILKAIAETNEMAQRKSIERDLVLIVGNTGAGKSVFVNYLLGNELIEAKLPKEFLKGIKCKNPSDSDPEIGFGFESKTSFPGFFNASDSSLTFCDCPGFFDNRGAVFDISNMYALAKMATSARSVKGVVVLINYHSLMADRARGLNETVSLLSHLFGPNNISNNPSILLLVTKAPTELTRDGLQETMREACVHFPPLRGLAERCELYDALDRHCAPPASRMSRVEILAHLKNFIAIDKDSLNVALSSDSLRRLGEMLRVMGSEAVTDFDQHDSCKTNSYIGILKGLQILKCSVVTQSLADFIQHMTLKVNEWSADLTNLDFLNDLKVEVPELEEVVQVAVNQMLQRIQVEKDLNHKVEVAAEDLRLAQLESKAAELKAAEAKEEVAAEKAKLQAEIARHRAEADQLRAEAQRPQVTAPSSACDPMLMSMLISQFMGQHQQQQPMMMGYPGGYGGGGGGGFDMGGLSDQMGAMSFGSPSRSSHRSSYGSSGSSRSPASSRSNGGRTWVAPYTRSNGTPVSGYYRKSRK
jgi:hypothetical protein